MATGIEIAETTLEAYRCEGGYIWGQQGAEWTKAKQAALEKKYNSDPEAYANYKGSATYGKKWIGHRVWDCAGLCRWAAKKHGIAIHSGSNLIWNCDLKEKGALTDGMELPEGALVFTGTKEKKPHVGTYTGNGLVTEASGAKAGVIQSNLHGGKWKWWGLEKGVEYDSPAPAPDPDPQPEPTPTEKKPTLRKGNRNQYVKQMQEKLAELGYDLGICGIDGDFGTATEAAVKKFQRDHGLTADGICGPKTWAALNAAHPGPEPKPAPTEEKYTVTITGLTKDAAEKICKEWSGATMKKE